MPSQFTGNTYPLASDVDIVRLLAAPPFQY